MSFQVDGISKPAESREVDLIIASNNAEAKVRTIAVKNILSSPVAGESSTNPEFVRFILCGNLRF
jgi:U3 small nucleolar RNA-associated protein 10